MTRKPSSKGPADPIMAPAEARLRLAIEAADLTIWECDPRAGSIHWSDNAAEVIGCRPEELPREMAQSLLFIASDDAARMLREYEMAVAARMDFYASEFRGRGDPATTSHFLARARIIYDDRGTPVQVIGVTQNVTERKRTQQALETHRELLETVVQRMPTAVALLRGSDLRLQMVNAAYQAIAPVEAMLGKTLAELWPEAERDFDEICRRVLETGEPHQAVDESFTIRRAPAAPLEQAYFSWSLHRVHLPNGEGWGLLNTVWETTARKRAEQGLLESEERFRTFFEDAALPLWEEDWSRAKAELDALVRTGIDDIGRHLAGDPTLVGRLLGLVKLVRTNEAAQELFRAPDHEALLENLERLIAPESWRVMVDQLTTVAENTQRFRGEADVQAFDGTRRAVIVDFVVLPGFEATYERVLVSLVDITERKQAEQALLRNQEKLAELNQTLEQRVVERSARLRALAAELAQTEQRERARMAQILHDHLQQLLVAAKMKLGAAIDHVFDARVRHVLEDVRGVLHESIGASRSLAVELSPPVLQQQGLGAALEWLAGWFHDKHGFRVDVTADPAGEPETSDTRYLIFQAVRELLLNVVKHAGVDRASVTLRRRDDHVQVEVADEGAGFDSRAFAISASEGFGLFSVEQRLAAIGGTLHVASARGRGTSVTLTAPLGRVEQRKEAGSVRRIRVLLADDHKFVRQGLVELLEGATDIEVVGEAADGREALDLVDRLQPQLVIMDVTMPRLNGIEATRRLKTRHPHIRVIALSMHNEASVASAMRDAGADAFLTKDRADKLVRTIRRAAA